MIRATIGVPKTRPFRRLGGLRQELLRAVQLTMIDAAATSKQKYLTGPRPGRLAPVTGRLRASIRSLARMEGRNIVGQLGTSPVKYARVHELGRGPIEIGARRAKALKITLPGGQIIFRKSARLPAYRGKPFLKPAIMAVVGKLIGRIEAAIKGAAGP